MPPKSIYISSIDTGNRWPCIRREFWIVRTRSRNTTRKTVCNNVYCCSRLDRVILKYHPISFLASATIRDRRKARLSRTCNTNKLTSIFRRVKSSDYFARRPINITVVILHNGLSRSIDLFASIGPASALADLHSNGKQYVYWTRYAGLMEGPFGRIT